MGTFADALKGVGFDVEEVKEINDFNDLKLPYMQVENRLVPVTVVNYQLLDDCRLIERTRKPLDVEWFKKNRKPFNNNDKGIYDWVLKHADKCYMVSHDGFCGVEREGHLYYGMCCMTFYITWNKVHKCLELDYGTENTTLSLFHPLWRKPVEYLDEMVKVCDFIPICVHEGDERTDSNVAVVSDVNTSEWVWGKNIIDSDNEDVKREYQRLLDNGFRINPKGKYYIFPKKRRYYRTGTHVYFSRIKGDRKDEAYSKYRDSLIY